MTGSPTPHNCPQPGPQPGRTVCCGTCQVTRVRQPGGAITETPYASLSGPPPVMAADSGCTGVPLKLPYSPSPDPGLLGGVSMRAAGERLAAAFRSARGEPRTLGGDWDYEPASDDGLLKVEVTAMGDRQQSFLPAAPGPRHIAYALYRNILAAYQGATMPPLHTEFAEALTVVCRLPDRAVAERGGDLAELLTHYCDKGLNGDHARQLAALIAALHTARRDYRRQVLDHTLDDLDEALGGEQRQIEPLAVPAKTITRHTAAAITLEAGPASCTECQRDDIAPDPETGLCRYCAELDAAAATEADRAAAAAARRARPELSTVGRALAAHLVLRMAVRVVIVAVLVMGTADLLLLACQALLWLFASVGGAV